MELRAIPEPASAPLLVCGLAGVIGWCALTMIGDLCYSINKRTTGRLQDELNELCNRLEYLEATGAYP